MSKFKSILPQGNENTKCKISGKHIHLYSKFVDGYKITRHIPGEKKEIEGYTKEKDFVRTDRFYDDILKLLNKKKLFRAEQNIDYLSHLVEINKPYIEYEYDNMEQDIKFTFDEEGNTIPLVKTVHKTGWHGDKNDPKNTGRAREHRAMFYGYKIIMEKDKPKLVKSPLVSDIAEIIQEYPYYCENCFEYVANILPEYQKSNSLK